MLGDLNSSLATLLSLHVTTLCSKHMLARIVEELVKLPELSTAESLVGYPWARPYVQLAYGTLAPLLWSPQKAVSQAAAAGGREGPEGCAGPGRASCCFHVKVDAYVVPVLAYAITPQQVRTT